MSDRKAEATSDSLTSLEDVVDSYWSTYRRHAHTLLAWGYEDSRRRVLDVHEEPDITGFIVEAIQDRFDSPSSPPWCDQIALKDDPPVPGGKRTGRSRWRPDLIFESLVGRRPRPGYHFEAKRLRRTGSERDYLGREGLGCFLSGMYASESDESGMLGYVQSGDVNTWMCKLQLAIDQDFQNGNKMFLLSLRQRVSVIDEFPQEWLSKHARQINNDIVIYHILLDYGIAFPEEDS